MRDGLYVVNKKDITAAFCVRDGKITVCAPILRKEIEYYKKIAKWYPTDTSILPVKVAAQASS
jgi:hypothetical protein